ncbi:MAG TPA: hypothetical protein VNA14_03715 [Mycobacteriales bacterium]|nr:hypothetical protein [Mycobacteriales bacterium]
MSKAHSPARDAWSWRHVFAAINATIACAAVLGQLPGQVAYLPLSYSLAGQIECVSAVGWTGWRGCADLGVPLGLPMLNAGPLVWIGALLNTLPGVSAHAAGQATLTTASGITLLATAAVLRRLGTSSTAAVIGGAAWLLTPTVVGLRHFNGTWSGLTLLPAFLLADVMLFERFRRLHARGVPIVLVAYLAIRCAAFFLDAYGFVISGLVSVGVLLLWPAPRGSSGRRRFLALGAAAMANTAAFLAYRAYVPPGSATYPSPMSQFRALGADVTSFVLPSRDVWWADLAGVARSSARMWGDGTNTDANYLGLLCVCLGLAGLIGPLRRSAHAPGLTAVAVVALALSLGPSMKVSAERASDRPVEHGHDWYEMPPEDGVTMPTSVLFARVPGLSTMRATYRWVAVTRLVLVLAAVVAVDAALRRARSRAGRGAVLAVAGLAVLELLPPVPRLIGEHSTRRAQLRAVHEGPVRDLQRVVDPGAMVLFLPVDNDYLANYLVPMAGLRSYNVGGDKNGHAARARWPEDVALLVVSHRTPTADVGARAVTVLKEHADALVLPRFSLRRDARSWPPSVRPVPAPFDRLLTDRRLVVEQHRWFVVIRLAPSP